jgi:hypothetical protein
VLGSALDKVLEKSSVPQSMSIYAASYCSQSFGGDGAAKTHCFLRESASFDIVANLRVVVAVSYALGIASSTVSLGYLAYWMWRENTRYGRWVLVFSWVAVGAVVAASLITTMIGCAVYMVFATILPESIVFVTIGNKFLAATWSGCVCLLLASVTMRSCVGSESDAH